MTNRLFEEGDMSDIGCDDESSNDCDDWIHQLSDSDLDVDTSVENDREDAVIGFSNNDSVFDAVFQADALLRTTSMCDREEGHFEDALSEIVDQNSTEEESKLSSICESIEENEFSEAVSHQTLTLSHADLAVSVSAKSHEGSHTTGASSDNTIDFDPAAAFYA
eukprot:scaffold45673_cov48-Attheya_sp.AAC.1